MYNKEVGILSPTGSGPWDVTLFFENTAMAKYLNLGDILTSGSGASLGKKYRVISGTWTGTPDFSNGGIVTVEWADEGTPVGPVADAGYLSLMTTPGQEPVRPEVQVRGSCGNISVFDSQNYEYWFGGPSLLGAVWDDVDEANKAELGDYIACSNGKMYEIVYFGPTKWAEGFRVVEVVKEGELPPSGNATLFRPTPGWERYQGDDLSDDARNRLYIADMARLDSKIPGDKRVVSHVITAGELLAKEFEFLPVPRDPSEVQIDIIGGTPQKYGTDYTVSGNVLSWSGLGLDGMLEENDEIILSYFS